MNIVIRINISLKRVAVETEYTTVYIENHNGDLTDIHYSNNTGEQVYNDDKEWEQSQLFELYSHLHDALFWAQQEVLEKCNASMDAAQAVIPFDNYIVE